MRTGSRIRTVAFTLGSALALVVALPGSALADPPGSLPGQADALEETHQPAYDYDGDGCYPTSAIAPDGTTAPGLNPGGDVNGDCHDASDLESTNGYARSKCNNGWCAVMYALYFEKDQAVAGSGLGGHRHDWEHVVVWAPEGGQAEYVATSAHGSFSVHGRDDIQWDGSHPKIVYHKDGISTHCFRPATTGDEPPENHAGAWQFPSLVGWEGYPEGLRDKLSGTDFGSANFGLKDASFGDHLEKAKPADIPFDPYA